MYKGFCIVRQGHGKWVPPFEFIVEPDNQGNRRDHVERAVWAPADHDTGHGAGRV